MAADIFLDKSFVDPPSVIGQKTLASSPWVKVIEREVCYGTSLPNQKFISIEQAPYVSVLAITLEGQIPLVRQFRPAVNEFTWEFPAGTLEPAESAESAAIRELAEEVGLVPGDLHNLGGHWADTGRLMNSIHCFVAENCEPYPDFQPEPGLEISYIKPATLMEWLKSGKFRSQLQIGLLGLLLLKPGILRKLELL